MDIGFVVHHLDLGSIQAMCGTLAARGIKMNVVVRENEHYLMMEAVDYPSARAALDRALEIYKMKLEVVYWDDDLGEFKSETSLKAKLGLADETDAWDQRNDRDPLSGYDGRADY